MSEQIKGYAYGQVAQSPVDLEVLDLLKTTVFFSDEDVKSLRLAGEVLKDQTNEVLDLWYGYVGSHQHLIHYFSSSAGADTHYLAAVRERFKQWVLDLCNKPFDQTWLNYQHEIALRHLVTKNRTDDADAAPFVHYRYMIAFIFPITITIRGFLASKGHDADTVEAMYNAWFKAIVLTTILWTQPYVKDGKF